MATVINDGMSEDPAILTVRRRLAGPPRRSADRAWTVLCHFWLTVLEQRAFPRQDEAAAALQALTPLGRQWMIRHVLEHEDLIFATGDLQLKIRVSYQSEPDEDLAPLPVELLDALPADAPLLLHVPRVSRVQEPIAAAAIAAAAEYGLTVRFTSDPTPETAKEQPHGHDAQ